MSSATKLILIVALTYFIIIGPSSNFNNLDGLFFFAIIPIGIIWKLRKRINRNMPEHWTYNYEGSQIRVSNSWVGSTKLYVNNQLQDKKFALFTLELKGELPGGGSIEATLKNSFLQVNVT